MKWSKHTIVLLGLNLVLLAGVGYLIHQLRRPVVPVSEVVATEPAPGKSWLPKLAPRRPPVPAEAGTNRFRWAQLESEDYRAYITRLREIGCPEQTIRDLIIADIDKLLAPRFLATVPYRKDLQYWQPEEQELWYDSDSREWARQQRELDYEKREVIRDLLGVDLVGERLRQQGQEDYHSRRLSFLPEAKRAQVRTLLDRYGDREVAICEKVWEEGEAITAEDREQLKRLRQERQAELARVLSPAELQQYDLWLGYSASKVRESTYGMDATEEEFLKLYGLRRTFDDQWNPDELDLDEAATQARWQQASAELENQIRQALGNERYALYQRGQDPDFRALNAAAARYKLPSGTAAEVHAYKQLVLEARQAVTANSTLTPEQQEQALKEITAETERMVEGALGKKAYGYLVRQGNAQWIKGSQP